MGRIFVFRFLFSTVAVSEWTRKNMNKIKSAGINKKGETHARFRDRA